MSTPLVEADRLCKTFGGIAAVKDVSFEIYPGEIVSIVGSNGAGKTTLFNLLSGYHRPSSGDIYFSGVRITDWRPERRVAAGMCRSFQKTRLFFRYTVEENIRLACFLHEKGGLARIAFGQTASDRQWISERVSSIIEFVGLERYRSYRASELSFGYQRSLEVAIAMSSAPKIILLDEPFAGLGVDKKELMARILRRLREMGTTLVFIEHDIESVISCCNRVFFMGAGRLQVPTHKRAGEYAPD